MTFVVLFEERDLLDNLSSCLTTCPERVILLAAADDNTGGPEKKQSQVDSYAKRYQELFSARGKNVRFETMVIHPNTLPAAVAAIEKIVNDAFSESEDLSHSLAFDITGGHPLLHVALGLVYGEFPDIGIQLHSFEISSGTVRDCDSDGILIAEGRLPELSVDELVRACGGSVVYEKDHPDGVHAWDMSPGFREQIRSAWYILCHLGYKNLRQWNILCDIFEEMERSGTADGLTTTADSDAVYRKMQEDDRPFLISDNENGAAEQLRRRGLADLTAAGGILRVTYANEQVKRMLLKAGQALELIVYLLALELKEQGRIDDVMTGVTIDWDGVIHRPDARFGDTKNEIDVIMIRDGVPVFISCKNGRQEDYKEEPYKLNSVASHFGGGYTKLALVATGMTPASAEQTEPTRYTAAEKFRLRLKDMDIRLIEPLDMHLNVFRDALLACFDAQTGGA